MTDQAVEGPLHDIRVLDLTRFPPGAYCTLLLVDLGADVYRFDPPGANPMSGGVGVGLSRGKRSVGVDLRNPRGAEILRQAAIWADVLVENSRPGEMEERGFGYPQAAEVNPRLVWCSISGFGQDGPYATWPGHDLTYTAQSGLLAAINPHLPWHPQTMLAVPLGAMMAATGIVSSLYERDRSGRGCQVDVSLAESATWLLSGSDGHLSGGHRSIPISPDRRLYRCSDGRYVTVAAAEPRTWAALCKGLGLDDLAEARPGPDQAEEVAARLEAVFANLPAAEWVARLGPLRAAIGPVNEGADIPGDPQVQARASVVDVDGVAVPANPIRLRDLEGPRSGTAAAAPPQVGSHTLAFLDAIGYSKTEVDELRGSGAIAG